MTAEELLRLCDRIISSGGFDTLTSIDRCAIARALRDRLTDAQAVTLTVADSKAQRGAGEYAKRSLLPYRISAKPSPQGAEEGDKP